MQGIYWRVPRHVFSTLPLVAASAQWQQPLEGYWTEGKVPGLLIVLLPIPASASSLHLNLIAQRHHLVSRQLCRHKTQTAPKQLCSKQLPN
ncbi:hypothetical protein V8C35DRAFT_292531 [Trichoderma chlorosporum]